MSDTSALDLAADLGRRVAVKGVREVVFGPVNGGNLRRRLTSAVGLLPLLGHWLGRCAGEPNSRAVRLALRIVGEGLNDPESLAIPAMSPRHERRLLSEAGFPPPNWWQRLGRILPGILALQQDPALSVDAAARTVGFARGVEFADCTRRTLGATPKEARTVLGWEGVVAQGLRVGGRGGSDAVAG